MFVGVAVPPQHGGGEAPAARRLAMGGDRVIAAAARGAPSPRHQRLRGALCTLHGTTHLPSLLIMMILSAK